MLSAKLRNESITIFETTYRTAIVKNISIRVIRKRGKFFFSRNKLSGLNTKKRKNAIANGIKIWLNSLRIKAITVIPITEIKNFEAESVVIVFIPYCKDAGV